MLNGLLHDCIRHKEFNALKVSPCESITYVMLVPFLVNANLQESCLYVSHRINVNARVEDATVSLDMFITCKFTRFAQSQAAETIIG